MFGSQPHRLKTTPSHQSNGHEPQAAANAAAQTGTLATLQPLRSSGWMPQRSSSNTLQLKKPTAIGSPVMQRRVDVNINKVQATSNTAEIDKNVTPVDWNQRLTPKRLESKQPGYIGSGIIYSGEGGATGLPKKYVEGSQDWSANMRKARLGVKFGINHMASVDPDQNDAIEHDVASKSMASFGNVQGKASAYIFGLTWGYSFKKGSIPGTKTMREMRQAIRSGKFGSEDIRWQKGDQLASKPEVVTRLDQLAKGKGIPYGMLRSWVTHNGQDVNAQLAANGASPTYYHSIDADAPDFLTLKEKSGHGWKKVLDAYDDVIKEQGAKKMIVGGYNLLAQPEEHTADPKDYERTVQSNVVDLAIRQAVHEVAPSMTYPTEPNFLIRTDTYHRAERQEAEKGNYVWGDKAFEGRNLYDSLIKSGLKPGKDVVYDPLASVATGVTGGGERLKVETGKRYDGNSIHGKPQESDKDVGDEIPTQEQYIVQAQSMAGASRLASAYVAAYNVLSDGDGVPKKSDVIPQFAPVESMVLNLLTGKDVASVRYPKNDGPMPISTILGSIQKRLYVLQRTKAFHDIMR